MNFFYFRGVFQIGKFARSGKQKRLEDVVYIFLVYFLYILLGYCISIYGHFSQVLLNFFSCVFMPFPCQKSSRFALSFGREPTKTIPLGISKCTVLWRRDGVRRGAKKRKAPHSSAYSRRPGTASIRRKSFCNSQTKFA